MSVAARASRTLMLLAACVFAQAAWAQRGDSVLGYHRADDRSGHEWQADGTLAEIIRRLNSSGREISPRGSIGATAAKPPAQPGSDRLCGAFWTNPASWRAPVRMA